MIKVLLVILHLQPCQAEDSDNCYWDAASRGNHRGQSFIALNGSTYKLNKPVETRR